MNEMIIDEIYSFKLHSSEEVVAKVVDVFDSYVVITNPMSLGSGEKGIGFIHSMITHDTEKPVVLNRSSYSIVAPTDEAIKSKYIEGTTGIKVPGKKVILG